MTKLKELERRLRDEPDNLGLRVSLAGALHEAGRRGDAVELYRTVAISYRDQGRPQQAITVCRSILELAPDDASCRELLATLLASQLATRGALPPVLPEPPASRASPVPRPSPPRAPSSEPEVPELADPVRRSSGDVTPLPLPLPYHEADPTTSSRVRLSRPDWPPSEHEAHASNPETAGIAAAARQISASLIAAARREAEREAEREADTEELDDDDLEADDLEADDLEADDLEAELDTGRLLRTGGPRMATSASEPPPIPRPPTPPVGRPPTSPPVGRPPASPPEPDTAELLGAMRASDDPDDDDPTLPPPPAVTPPPTTVPPTTIDDEKTEPRELPTRARSPSAGEAGTRGVGTPTAVPAGRGTSPVGSAGALDGAFFAPLPPSSRSAVLQRFQRRSVAAGTVVIRRGDTDHGLVVVVRGRLDVHAERPDGARVALGALGPGEFVGEASLLAQVPAAADVVAGVDAELLVLLAEDFRDVTRAFPALRSKLAAVAGRRARDREQRRKG